MSELLSLRKTKIVATIGPASSDPKILRSLIEAGLNVARLNFSHGDHDSHRRIMQTLRELGREMGREIGILQDLSGPKMRLGNMKERLLTAGETVLLSAEADETDESLPVNYPYLLEDVNVGEKILLADGKLELQVTERLADRLKALVITGGALSSHKGVNLPNSNLRIKAFTDKDRDDLNMGLMEGVDFVAMSFVRHENDLLPAKEMIRRSGRPPLLIAKIEKPQAVERIEEILDAADGLMVARGDLGVEMSIEQVPVIQKKLIQAARHRAKVVITATQMLGSMVANPRPSRAEVTDVANAILDGTDAVMLSEETAAGQYPVESVAMLDKVARQTEPLIEARKFLRENSSEKVEQVAAGITRAVSFLARDLSSQVIVAATQGGSTARLMSQLRQPLAVVGLTSSLTTYRQLTLSWGIIPALIQPCNSMVLLEQLASEWLVRHRLAKKGDRVFLTCGLPLQISGTTNLIKLLDIGEVEG